MKKLLKKVIQPVAPQSAINLFHYGESLLAAKKSGYPSERMIIIGIVGSKGKTTTANMLWSILSADGTRVGLIGTANIRYGQREQLNPYHMTMPGAFVMQSILKRMAELNCKYVIMEVPSEGQAQFRHIGINFDVLVFTNVTRELMAVHKFSENLLHKHNKRVFTRLDKSKRKEIASQTIPKIVVANADSKHFEAYYSFPADKKVSYSIKSPSDFKAKNITSTTEGVSFEIKKNHFEVNILGSINAINATAAIATAQALAIPIYTIQKGLKNLPIIPGRMEPINQGQQFAVIVDYAHEQASMKALMQSAKELKDKNTKIITVLGAEGGGRDVAKRPQMGKIVAKNSDFIIITNVDPYDDDPDKIIDDIAIGAQKAGAKVQKNLFLIPDRALAIKKAFELAKKDDLVFITGKGAEQSMIIGDKVIKWDDRKVARKILASFGYNKTT